jgi:hypothetical protein
MTATTSPTTSTRTSAPTATWTLIRKASATWPSESASTSGRRKVRATAASLAVAKATPPATISVARA